MNKKWEFLQKISEEVFLKKYCLNNETSVEEVLSKVSKKVASCEKNNKKNLIWEKKFYDSMINGYLIPGGRILANAKFDSKVNNYSNCFVIDINDDLGNIYDSLKESAMISKMGGGWGINISKLRPKNDSLSIGGVSSGPVSFMRVFNESGKIIMTGGQRRSAILVCLNVDHPDIEEFITCKRGDENKSLTQMNISVGITDNFIYAVENDLDWNLQFKGKIYKTIKAKYLYNLICKNSFQHNEPGILCIDTINHFNNAYWYESIQTSNPCMPNYVTLLVKENDDIIEKPLKEIKIGDDILSEDGFVKVINKCSRGIKSVYRYFTKHNNRQYIDLTENHKVKEKGIKKEIKDCIYIDCFGYTQNDSIFTFADEILEKKYIGELEVFDITVEGKNHTFWCNGYNIFNCGEIPLLTYEACNLTSINLTSFIENPYTNESKFNYEKFKKIIHIGIRFLDNIIDLTEMPLSKITKKIKLFRKCGLGITGLADMFVMLKIKYGSQESKEMCHKIGKILRDESYRASVNLAKEKGCPKFLYKNRKNIVKSNFIFNLPIDIKKNILKYGIRNIALNTIAPVGTTSIALGQNCSSGIEPIFSLEYERKIRIDENDNIKIEKVKDYAFLLFNKLFPNEIIPEYFVTTFDINVLDSIEIQSILQSYIDNSISKTLNLPNNYSFNEYQKLFLYAYKKGVKGFTTFNPNGSLKGILSIDNKNINNINHAKKRPSHLECDIYRVKVKEKEFTILVGLDDETKQPFELFVDTNHVDVTKYKKGIIYKRTKRQYDLLIDDEVVIKNISREFNKTYGTLTRMISMSLRHNVELEFIVDQLSKSEEFISFDKAIARVLKKYIRENEKVKLSKKCDNCGSTDLIYIEGCISCRTCLTSKCG